MLRKVKEEKNFRINKGGVFFSNSVEVLVEYLKTTLYTLDKDVFSERVLIVPSLGMQHWIPMQLASSLSVASGILTTLLNKGITILCEKLFSPQKERFLPSQLELFLRIQEEIRQILYSADPLWGPLVSYIQGKENRLISLAQHLTQLFLKYGLYGAGITEQWEKEPSDWQEALWKTIFQDWEYPHRAYSTMQIKKELPANLSVHLFAFSHLSAAHFRFFCHLSQWVPIYFYQLSPCKEFWSDLTKEHPSLLGSLGKVGREMAKLIEVSECDPEAAYLNFGGKTQLRQLQRSLLSLEELDASIEDDSLQLHMGITPYQEIETLHQTVYALFQTGQIEPKDVIVMAPQITQYIPYIQAVFKDLPYQITDVPIAAKDPLILGFLLLVELEKKRWSAHALLELFHHPLFRQKQGWTEEECQLISKWVEKTAICWGMDGEHRAHLLAKEGCPSVVSDSQTTWMHGLRLLQEEFALSSLIPSSQSEFLSELILLLQTMYKELQELESSKTLCEWSSYFRGLITTYFIFEKEEALFSALKSMEKVARTTEDKTYGFMLAHTLLKEALGQETETLHRHLVQAIRFCSLLPMRTLPAKIICLLGMNHDTFPRKEQFKGLDLLKQHKGTDYFPSRADYDRYLILEALLSAREKLIISYLGRDLFELTELPPSTVVTEFLPYISKQQIKVHDSYDLSHIKISPLPPFSIKLISTFILPKGEFTIDHTELVRLIRSPLSHYLAFRNLNIAQEERTTSEEPFILSPLKRAILKKEALRKGKKTAFELGEKIGAFPLGVLGEVARHQLEEECNFFVETKSKTLEIPPLKVEVTSSLSVVFTGFVGGVTEEGLCIPEKFSFKNALKLWPAFLLLYATDPTKRTLLFTHTEEVKEAFFESPLPFLIGLAELFFYAQTHPLYFSIEWIESILKKDEKQLTQNSLYDFHLKWQLRGGRRIEAEKVIDTYYPLLNRLYGEMAHAWC